jgi:hypothetical protein
MKQELKTIFPACFAALFLEAFDASEFEVGPTACFIGRQAGRDVIGDLLLEMEMQLRVEPFFDKRLVAEAA